MTPFQKRLTPITKRMAEDMLLRNMSLRTIDSYTYHVDRFAKHFGGGVSFFLRAPADMLAQRREWLTVRAPSERIA
jgi:hypothetical protein